MKTALSLILIFSLGLLGYVAYTKTYNPCDIEISYKIGTIDPKFDLDKQEVLENTIEATEILNNEYGKDLFVYREDAGELTVNFYYDERTALNADINKSQEEIDQQNRTLQQNISKYETEVKSFVSRLADHNALVDKYNKEGGASPDAYNDIIRQQNLLKAEGEALNSKARQLNLETNNYNSQVGNLNKDVVNFNQALTQKPEEGLYDPTNNTIKIYFVDNKPELIHTLAHEFGHALGMNHVENPKALMFPLSSTYLDLTEEDKNELMKVCKKVPAYEYWITRYLVSVNNLINN